MARFDPLLDLAGTVLVVVGVAIAVGGIPYAALTDQAPVLRSGLLYAAGGAFVLAGGVVLHPKSYEAIDVPGFEERSERAVWATLVFVSFGRTSSRDARGRRSARSRRRDRAGPSDGLYAAARPTDAYGH